MHYDKKMINRINRIQGQLNGVIKMMEEDKKNMNWGTSMVPHCIL